MLLTLSDVQLKRAVCNAFANLCSDEDNIEEVLGDGGLALIISFLDSVSLVDAVLSSIGTCSPCPLNVLVLLFAPSVLARGDLRVVFVFHE